MNSSASATPDTVRSSLLAVEDFATYFHWSPKQLEPNYVRNYQIHLFRDRTL
jgi:hypothetical protein